MENNIRYGSIYIIKNNLSDKIYIGQTIKTLEERLVAHKRCAKSSGFVMGYQRPKTKITNAINTYGEENFNIFKIRDCSDKEELDYYEEQYINLYNSVENGYNLEYKCRGIGRMSEETRQKSSLAHSKDPFNLYNIKGEFLGTYNRLIAAIDFIFEKYGVKINIGSLGKVLTCELKHVRGYVGIPVEDDEENFRKNKLEDAIIAYNKNSTKKRPIKLFLKNGKFIGDYESITECALKNRLNKTTLTSCLNRRCFMAEKYIVIYTCEFSEELLQHLVLVANY